MRDVRGPSLSRAGLILTASRRRSSRVGWRPIAVRLSIRCHVLVHLFKAFSQAGDPALRRVIVRGAAAAVALFVVLIGAAAWGLQYLSVTGTGWIDSIIATLGGV